MGRRVWYSESQYFKPDPSGMVWPRFSQPDPYDGSYNLGDPQSFNRYSYTQNDPVNFVDPSGLLMIIIWGQYCSQVQGGDWLCYYAIDQIIDLGSGFGGGPGGRGPGGGGPGGGVGPQKTNGGFPCPPTGKELARNPTVVAALDQAFADSGDYGTLNIHEERGWIYMDGTGTMVKWGQRH